MSRLEQISTVDTYVKQALSKEKEQIRAKCYLYRRVLDMTPVEAARELKIHPKEVNILAASVSGLFEAINGPNTYSYLLKVCSENIWFNKLQNYRAHQSSIFKRSGKTLDQILSL